MHQQESRSLKSKRKVAIVGIGYVGASIAYALTVRNFAHEIVLIDIDYKKAEGEALDIQHGIPYMGISSVYAGDFRDCTGCDLIIITAGRNRNPNETRLNLINDNSAIVRKVVDHIMPHYTRGVIMIVTNPVDILTYQCTKWMGLPNGIVFGTGCILDTSRFIQQVAEYAAISTDSIKGFVVGEHGDAQIPIWSRLTIAGVTMEEYCCNIGLPWSDQQKMAIYNRVKGMGAEIIRAKGRTHYGIATCVCYLADAILNQRSAIVSVSTPLEGEYGIDGVALSVPSIISGNGVIRRLEEHWDEHEKMLFLQCSKELKSLVHMAGIPC